MTTTLYPARLDTPPTDIGGLRAIVDALDDGSPLAYDDNPEAFVSDNLHRAGCAARAVLTFADRCFAGPEGSACEDFHTVIGDLLADLLHLCDALGVSYEELEQRGRRHYDCEVTGDVW